jgi:hypothetical protein
LDVSEHHWISDTVAAQRIERQGIDSLYVGSVEGASASFYSIYELSLWFKQEGVEANDPVWDYLEQLELDELFSEVVD